MGPPWLHMGGYTPLMFAAQDGRRGIGQAAHRRRRRSQGRRAGRLQRPDPRRPRRTVGRRAVCLLSAGADPNDARAGYTALHVAATAGDLALVTGAAGPRRRSQRAPAEGQPDQADAPAATPSITGMVGATPFILAACARAIWR